MKLWFPGLLLLVAVDGPRPAIQARKAEEQPRPLTPAANLKVRFGEHPGASAELLDPENAAWQKAALTRALLSRTPRIYQTEPIPTTRPPVLEVRCLKAGQKLFVRLSWQDPTRDAPVAPPRKTGEGGDPGRLYKQPTGETAAFADAAAIMVPERWSGGEFPSLVMGDKKTPVNLFYWNASRGAEELKASGRATPSATGKAVTHRAKHAEGRWSLILELTAVADGSPIAFAIWDGNSSDRDGLKFFSIWYVLKAE